MQSNSFSVQTTTGVFSTFIARVCAFVGKENEAQIFWSNHVFGENWYVFDEIF